MLIALSIETRFGVSSQLSAGSAELPICPISEIANRAERAPEMTAEPPTIGPLISAHRSRSSAVPGPGGGVGATDRAVWRREHRDRSEHSGTLG
jgi:hypothetical protein